MQKLMNTGKAQLVQESNWNDTFWGVYKGEGETIEYQGLRATPDHYVWVEGEQRPLPFGFAAGSGFDLVKAGHCGHEVRA